MHSEKSFQFIQKYRQKMCEAQRRTLPVVSLHSDAEDQLEDDLVASLHLEEDLVSMHLGKDDKLGNLEDFEESDIESDDLEFESDLKTKLEEVEKTSINVLEEEGEVAVEDEEVADEKEEVADEEEEGGAELVDDDNNKQKPQFIPRRGLFYEHDNRSDPGDNEFSTNQEEDLARTEREKKHKKEKHRDHDKEREESSIKNPLSSLMKDISPVSDTLETRTSKDRENDVSPRYKSPDRDVHEDHVAADAGAGGVDNAEESDEDLLGDLDIAPVFA